MFKQFVLLYPLGLTEEKGKFDELVEEKGVSILVEPKAVMHVIGMKMDFVDDKLRFVPFHVLTPLYLFIRPNIIDIDIVCCYGRSEFVFINPNSIGECGCGESFISKST